MPAALSFAPLTLAAVLLLSGLAKLRDPGATTSMIRALRLPTLLRRRIVAQALPVVELATSVLLLTPWRWTYAIGAVAAAALFVVFFVIVARAMGFTPRPTCSCFGRVGDHRISVRTLLRNMLLVALAGVALGIALGGGSATGLVAGYTTGDWVWAACALALAAVAVLVLGRAAGDADDASDDLGSVADAPAEGTTPAGPYRGGVLVDSRLRPSSLAALTRERPQLLILVNCWCGSTYAAIQRLPDWRARLGHLGVPLVHTRVPWDDAQLGALPDVLWDPGSQVYSLLRAGSSPCAVLLGHAGEPLRAPASGIEAIQALVDTLSAPGERPSS